MAATCDALLVIEDGQPFVEEQLTGILDPSVVIKGRLDGTLPRDGELTPDNVGIAFASNLNQPLPFLLLS